MTAARWRGLLCPCDGVDRFRRRVRGRRCVVVSWVDPGVIRLEGHLGTFGGQSVGLSLLRGDVPKGKLSSYSCRLPSLCASAIGQRWRRRWYEFVKCTLWVGGGLWLGGANSVRVLLFPSVGKVSRSLGNAHLSVVYGCFATRWFHNAELCVWL